MVEKIKVSEEYLDTVCQWLEEWVTKPSSLAIPQFLAEKGIGWKYFQQFRDLSPRVNNTFEVVIAQLHAKWMKYAFSKKILPKHLTSILMRYLRVYDDHAYQVEIAAKKEISENSSLNFVPYESKNYGNSSLQGIYKKFYKINEDKRRYQKKDK